MNRTGGLRGFYDLSPAEREAAREMMPELVEAAADRLADGFWTTDEHEVLGQACMRLGVWVWPAYYDRIVREARRQVPRATWT